MPRSVVDALDPRGERGALVPSVGAHPTALLRIYGADDVLRGLVLEGSTDSTLTTQADKPHRDHPRWPRGSGRAGA